MFNLLRYFSLTSAAVILVIALAMHAAYRQIAVGDLVTMAERHNVALAQSFANTLWSGYSSYVTSVSRADGDTLRAHPETRSIHEALKTLTTKLPVLKVKIYNVDGLTVYSSQPSQMGADKSENRGFLGAALGGTPTSKLSHRDSFSAFSGIVHDRDLVETYIPIRGVEGRIEGVFELYTDVTPLVAKIETNSTLFFVGLLFSFGLLYAILFLIIRRADLILKKQYVGLRSNEERIKAKNVELVHEVTERRRAEEALRALEQRLRERAVELEREIAEHERTGAKLRESEERFKDFAEAASDWFWEQDADLRFTAASPGVYEKSGVTAADHVGKTRRDIVSLGVTEEQWRQHEADLAARRPFRDFTFQRRDPSGKLRDFSLSGKPVFDAEGRFKGYRGMATDITDRKNTENALRAAHDMLEHRVRELRAAQADLLRQERMATLGQLTATVSHELRNPLGVIRTSSFIVSDGLNGEVPRVKRALERIERSVIRCDRIIDELLDFTRIRDLEPEATAINVWLGDLLDEQPLPEGVKLCREFGAPEASVSFDHDRFRRAVINVFENACQAITGKGDERAGLGKGVLTVTTRKTDGRVEVVFEDSGPGIPPDVLPKIFEPLFSTKGFGVGLGLPVVKQIMEQHGGGIEVETEEGHGTRFVLRLPTRRAEGEVS